ncbi:MAG: ABC transporter substrate-binding protein [Bacillota bacterium]
MLLNLKNIRLQQVTVVLLAALMIFAFSFQVQAQAITDDLGNEVELEEAPERIISLAPNMTEMLFAIGLGDKVVGVTSYCDYPEAALEVDEIGTITEPNIEEIVSKDPDLVVAAGINPMEVVERLQELDITVVGFYPDSVETTFSAMSRLGVLTGNIDQAAQVINSMESDMDQILDVISEVEDRPTVFYEIWNDPLTTAGGNNFIDNMITLAGGRNIGAEAGEGWPQFSREDLIMKDPDIYISTPHSADHQVSREKIMERENYHVLTAVQEDRVHIVNQDLISRSSPRLIEGLKQLAAALHPELAEEIEDI